MNPSQHSIDSNEKQYSTTDAYAKLYQPEAFTQEPLETSEAAKDLMIYLKVNKLFEEGFTDKKSKDYESNCHSADIFKDFITKAYNDYEKTNENNLGFTPTSDTFFESEHVYHDYLKNLNKCNSEGLKINLEKVENLKKFLDNIKIESFNALQKQREVDLEKVDKRIAPFSLATFILGVAAVATGGILLPALAMVSVISLIFSFVKRNFKQKENLKEAHYMKDFLKKQEAKVNECHTMIKNRLTELNKLNEEQEKSELDKSTQVTNENQSNLNRVSFTQELQLQSQSNQI